MPTAALRELLDDPRQMALDVMELRAYARAKNALDNAKDAKDIPDDPMVDRVWEIMHELQQGRKEG